MAEFQDDQAPRNKPENERGCVERGSGHYRLLSKAPAACDYDLSRVLVHRFRKPQLRRNTRDSQEK